MLALKLLVTATLTAWAVTTYTPEIMNKLSVYQYTMKNRQRFCTILHHTVVKILTTLFECN